MRGYKHQPILSEELLKTYPLGAHRFGCASFSAQFTGLESAHRPFVKRIFE